MSQHIFFSVEFIFASLYALSVIYLLPVMIHGYVRKPPFGQNKYMFSKDKATKTELTTSNRLF